MYGKYVYSMFSMYDIPIHLHCKHLNKITFIKYLNKKTNSTYQHFSYKNVADSKRKTHKRITIKM